MPESSFRKSKAVHLRLGRRGENLAALLLRELGLDILMRNYFSKRGELDIVAREDTVLCFIEVKTRRRIGCSRPADAVGHHKKRQIMRVAGSYLAELNNPLIIYRYDIVEVVLNGRRTKEIRYWRNAFTEEEFNSVF
ncbi:MAG: YraN family protein [Verrucomicrobiota bacterium]